MLSIILRQANNSSVCYDICDVSFLAAQTIGKDPSICDPDSAFINYYTACLACLQTNPSPDLSATLNNNFQSFDGYCQSLGIELPAAIVTSVVITISNHPLTIPISTVVGVATYVPSSTRSTALSSIFNASSAAWSGSSKTSLSPSTSPTNSPSEGSDSSSRGPAWVAGPAVGSIAGILLLVILPGFLWYRHRKRLSGFHDPYEKPQLHSDCIPRQEIEDTQVCELEVPPAELKGTEQLPELADTSNRQSESVINDMV
ncbi:hypothetical protein F4823DRAFT_107689 [Ustulina deusta]|nr:hypothetical protein F4823DRAFT_107689 [Ustulina deusta]